MKSEKFILPPAIGRKAPLVSALMAVHNGGPEVLAAALSILQQDLSDLELVVVDDASTDNTAEHLRNLGDQRLKILRQDERQGLTRSLLRGWEACQGEMIARLDADDLAYPGRLSAQAAFLRENPEVLVVGGDHIEFVCDPPPLPQSAATGASDISFADLLEHNRFCHSAVMFRRQMIARGLAYRAPFARSQDYDLWLRTALAGRICKLHQPVCAYRRSPRSISLTCLAEQFRYAAWARLLALERQRTGSDSLDRSGDWPKLSAAIEDEIKRKTATALIYFSRKFLRSGQWQGALLLFGRAIIFSPLLALRAIAAAGRTDK
ncbi:MAG: glycosyltransferase [Planctomycetota bacterium]|nr:glycosyltransferase [Planctomycetota bacterium]